MDSSEYHSLHETVMHIRRVGVLLTEVTTRLIKRAIVHDHSKFGEHEWPFFSAVTAKLKGLTYGSSEYKTQLDEIRPAIDHHQQTNSHHPEYHHGDLAQMSLLDLMEMLADWKAAGERNLDGSLEKSLRINAERFKIPMALQTVLMNTADELGWLQTPYESALAVAQEWGWIGQPHNPSAEIVAETVT